MPEHRKGDLWQAKALGRWIVIPTNICVKANGDAVMGKGLALQAQARFHGLARRYGEWLKEREASDSPYVLNGRTYPAEWEPFVDRENRLILLPTKTDWRKPAHTALVRIGLEWLALHEEYRPLSCPYLGCGEGGLNPCDFIDQMPREFPGDVEFLVH